MPAYLFRNFSYITLSQAANYLIPLITIPYISRTVGVDKFGILEYSYTLTLYFIQIVEYSFDITATRRMAVIAHRPVLVSRLFSTVFWSKIFLWVMGALVFAAMMVLKRQLHPYMPALLGYFAMTISFVFTQNWFFQGLQKLGAVALANVAIKLIFALLLFSLVKNESDYYLVAVSTSLGYLIVSAFVFRYSFRLMPELRLRFPGIRLVLKNLTSGFYVFAGGMANKVYALGGMYWAGLLLSGATLGFYGAAHKLYLVAQSMMFYPLHMTLLPHLAQKASEGITMYKKVLFKYIKWLVVPFTGAGMLLFLVSEPVVKLLFGLEYRESIELFRWFIPSLVAGLFIHMFVYQAFIHLKKDDAHLKILLVMMVISLVGNYFAIRNFGAYGGAVFRSVMDAGYVLLAWRWVHLILRDKE